MRFVAAIAALATLMPLASAQRGASAGHASAAGHASVPAHIGAPHSNLSKGNFAFGRNSRASASRRSSSYPYGYASLPFPFFGDSFDPDDIYSTGYPVASPPPPFLMQALSGLTGSSANPMADVMSPAAHQPSSTDPLMIELQNGRYVRVTSTAANGDALPLASSPPQSATSSGTRSTSTRFHAIQPRHTPADRYRITAIPAAGSPRLSRRPPRRSPRLHHRRRLPLRPRRLLHRRILEQENRSLHSQREPNPPSQRRPQRKLHPPQISQRSNHPPIMF